MTSINDQIRTSAEDFARVSGYAPDVVEAAIRRMLVGDVAPLRIAGFSVPKVPIPAKDAHRRRYQRRRR